MHNDWKKAEDALKKGGVAVIPTDTLYGLVASAFNKKAVERVYKIRGRDKNKPCIVLISSFIDLKKFEVSINDEQKKFLESVWPGKVSVVLPCTSKKLDYLHRGTKTIAFRMIGPRNKNLLKILKSVGPLVAPSANPQGLPPAKKRSEARKYFGKEVDAYVCVGTKDSKPSTLIEYKKGKLFIIREGAVKIKKTS
jgi:L-threonylcarbamoyladenylate synthase